jgi:hypothetical protein
VLYSWGTLRGFILGRGESETELIRPTYSERINRTVGVGPYFTPAILQIQGKFGPAIAKRNLLTSF